MSLKGKAEGRGIYFPGLNGLRFIAAFIVIICHIEQQKYNFKLPNLFHNSFFHNAAGLGVTLFFVLSGFLITYLLLAEKTAKRTINLKLFYIRRVLRIWPLYFLIVFLGILVWPRLGLFQTAGTSFVFDANFNLKLILYVLILPNVVHILKWDIPHVGQTWSIGVEEQFYLLWPVIFKFSKNVIPWLFFFIAFIVVASNGLFYLHNHNLIAADNAPIQGLILFVARYLTYFRISCMSIGALGAYVYFIKKEKILQVVYNKWVQISCIATALTLMLSGTALPYINHEFYSILFIVIILNVATNTESILKMENSIFNFLGKISYGIYMFHGAVIVFTIKLLKNVFNWQLSGWKDNLILYTIVFIIAILIAYLSYEFFEKRFLHLKEKFSVIKSNRTASSSQAIQVVNSSASIDKKGVGI